ncbi:MAG: glycerophosphodiester phosphodiesterase [Phycisphaerales bacterium]|nr:glycerophosphodiester phosphodiesterase [Phycisphaerales bacterium]
MQFLNIIALLLVSAMSGAVQDTEKTTMIVAHRGASNVAPENTLVAFRMGFAEGADRIEGDFRITADGEVVCIHDKTTGRTTDQAHDLVVHDSVLAQLRHLDVGSWKNARFEGEGIPTLEEVLAAIPRARGAVIELKGGSAVSGPAAEIVKASGIAPARLAFIAFDAETLAEVKRAAPEYPAWFLSSFKQDKDTGRWTPGVEELIATAKRIKADGLDVKAEPAVVNEAFVAKVREAGLALHVWTVNDPDLARRMAALGVDSITTDVPRRTRTALSEGR